jgi:hypothetical protein
LFEDKYEGGEIGMGAEDRANMKVYHLQEMRDMNLSNLDSAEDSSGQGENFGFFEGIHETSESSENSERSMRYNDADCEEHYPGDSRFDSPPSSPDFLSLQEPDPGSKGHTSPPPFTFPYGLNTNTPKFTDD